MRVWASGTLRRSLTLSMMAAAAVAIAVGAVGLWALGELQLELWHRSMPPRVRAAFNGLEKGAAPDAALLPEMMAYAENLERYVPLYGALSILFCAALAMAVAIALSISFSRRLVSPMESVAEAASAVAAGDLTARVDVGALGVGEARRLQDNFNSLIEALETAEREHRETSAAIAHELRTPITVLGLKLRSFRDGLGEATPQELGRLISQVDILARLVEDLRTLSLATAGRLELASVPLDLADLATDVADAMRPGLDAAKMSLQLQLSPAKVQGDPLRLRQCVQALVDNAIQHAALGREAFLETGSADGRAWLVLRDRGPGFAADDQMRAFDRFWRAEGSRSRRSGGSGLGLSVVAAIAAAHSGTVEIEHHRGLGACLRLTLPSGSGNPEA